MQLAVRRLRTRFSFLVPMAVTAAVAVPVRARAQAAAPTEAAPALPRPVVDFTVHDADRASFNGGRYVAEVLVSAVGGSLAGYGTYKAACGSDACLGGALAGAGVNVLATPLITMGTGALMGGRGNFLWTASFGLLGFSATAALSNQDPFAAMAVSLALMPLLAPLGYELSSNMRAR
jgi:hypothetical protein